MRKTHYTVIPNNNNWREVKNKMKLKGISSILVVLMLIAMPVSAQADYLSIDEVRLNTDTVTEDHNLYVERGEDLDLRVILQAEDERVEGAQVQAFIAGYRHVHYERDLVSDYTRTFNIPENSRRSFDLNLAVPMNIEQKDAKLRIVVSDENTPGVITKEYQLNIYGTAEDKAVDIRDFYIAPTTDVMPGRALTFDLRVRNMGNHDLDDVSAEISIPGLNLRAYETLDSLEIDESKAFEALMLRIPSDAEPGEYDVNARVKFDRFEEVMTTKTIRVLEEDVEVVEDETIVTTPGQVNLKAGGSDRVIPVLIENKGERSQTYRLSTTGVDDWGTATFDSSSVIVVQGESSKTAHLRLSADADAEGDQVFQIVVEGDRHTEEMSVVAKVEEDETTFDVREILEWSLVILIALLIILGLILVATKLRGKKSDEEEDEAQTYY